MDTEKTLPGPREVKIKIPEDVGLAAVVVCGSQTHEVSLAASALLKLADAPGKAGIARQVGMAVERQVAETLGVPTLDEMERDRRTEEVRAAVEQR